MSGDSDICWGCGLLVVLYLIIQGASEYLGGIVVFILIVLVISIPIIILYYIVRWFTHKNRDDSNSGIPSIVKSRLSKNKPTLQQLIDLDDEDDVKLDKILSLDIENEDYTPEIHQLSIEILDIDDKEPIENANVIIENAKGFCVEKISDIDGKVMFPRLETGEYNVKVTANGHFEEEQDIHHTIKDKKTIALKKSATLKITVLDAAIKAPVEDVTVTISNDEYQTDQNGTVCIKGLSFGNININAKTDQYFEQNLDFLIEHVNSEVILELKPNLKLDKKYIDIRQEYTVLFQTIFNKLPTSIDFLIPNYYKAVFEHLVQINESIYLNPVYRQISGFENMLDMLYGTLKKIYHEIDMTLTDSDMINDFISMSIHDNAELSDIDISYDKYNIDITSFMNDPGDFINQNKENIQNTLAETDKKITDHLGHYNISPIAGLWTISRKFVYNNSDNVTENAATLLLGNILLDSTIKMFEIEEIVKRLKQQY